MPSIVVNDPGGSVVAHGFHYGLLAAKGYMFKVIYCASACVMAITSIPSKQVCFFPRAWIGVHRDANVNGSEPSWRMKWWRGSEWIAQGWQECK